MAQSLSFFGNRRGSTKSHTYQVNGGQQITKDRVDEVKNPRTNGQMVHRCCLHTLSDAHAYLRPFIGGFWEGARSPQAALAAFRKANYPIVRAAAESGGSNFSFSPYHDNISPIGEFQISKGELSVYDFSYPFTMSDNNWFTLNLEDWSVGDEYYYDWLASRRLQFGDKLHLFIFLSVVGQIQLFPLVVTLTFKNVPNNRLNYFSTGDNYSVDYYFPNGVTAFDFFTEGVFSMWFEVSGLEFEPNCFSVGAVVERVKNGKHIFSTSKLKVMYSVPPSPSFPEAIATYPQGGGNVLDGGPV